MRVLFTTFAADTHMYAQVPMAWALHNAGHEVVVASQPDLVADITRTGLTAVPVGRPLNLVEEMAEAGETLDPATLHNQDELGLDMRELRPEKHTWDYVLNVFTAMTAMAFQNNCPESMVDDLVAFSRQWRPDLVVWDTMSFAGPVAARACGAAHARLLYGLDLVGKMRRVFLDLLERRPAELRDDPLREWLTWSLERHGCDGFAEDMVVGQWSIDQNPSWMRLESDLHYVPVRYIPYNGPSAVPDWVQERPERKRVCLTLGLSRPGALGAGGRASVGDLLEAVADLDVEVVATLTRREAEALPAIPGNVRVVDFVPLNALLPTCSAIVHHGGSGTLTTAMAHGVPQLIVPHMIWDSTHTARLLRDRGAGLCAEDPAGLSPGELRSRLLRLLEEPSFAARAAELRQEMVATPGPNDIVPVLEKLTAEHRADH
ncbi:activator-dependent family glycosyltransferase [Spirillospora sp. NPDC050679]